MIYIIPIYLHFDWSLLQFALFYLLFRSYICNIIVCFVASLQIFYFICINSLIICHCYYLSKSHISCFSFCLFVFLLFPFLFRLMYTFNIISIIIISRVLDDVMMTVLCLFDKFI